MSALLPARYRPIPLMNADQYASLGRWIDTHHPQQIEFLRQIARVPTDLRQAIGKLADAPAAGDLDSLVLLDPGRIVGNLHDAYRERAQFDARYGVFMTGPSATADIEGVLIHGAQGIRTLTVILAAVR